MRYIIEEIVKNKDVIIKVLQYKDVDVSEIDLTIFNTNELTEFNSFKSVKRQLEYYYARLLWQSFGQQEFIKYKLTGKPILDTGYISISHSHQHVALAFSSFKPVGMDLEQESNKVQIVKSKYLHETELFSSIPDLTKIWTIKEAIYKLYDSDLLFFKEHIIITSLQSSPELNVSLEGKNVFPKIKTIELENRFILTFAQ